MNRQKRRASEKKGAILMQGKKTAFVPVDMQNAPEGVTRLFRNNYYFIFVYDDVPTTGGNAIRVLIRANDQKPIKNHWAEIQNIKNELFGSETLAIEYFPPETKLVDKANIYWIWIFPEGVIPTPIL